MSLREQNVTVEKVFAPKDKGPGAIYDTQGRKWKFWGNDFKESDFRVGATYDITYKPGTYQGKPDNVLETKLEVTGQQLAPPPANGNGHSDNRDKNIFICGVVNQGIAAGKIDPFSTIDLLNVRKAATEAFEKCP